MTLRVVRTDEDLYSKPVGKRQFLPLDLAVSDFAIRLGYKNEPSIWEEAALRHVCDQFLNPFCELLGVRPEVQIISGFRSKSVNQMMQADPRSAHTTGEAIDISVSTMRPIDCARFIQGSRLPFDRLILEYYRAEDPMSGWVHIECRKAQVRGAVQTLYVVEHGRTTSVAMRNGLPR